MPNPRLLMLMMTFICSTLFAAWARPLGIPVATVAGLFGAAVGWVGTRWLMRKMF